MTGLWSSKGKGGLPGGCGYGSGFYGNL
jgi:hypothetical protein